MMTVSTTTWQQVKRYYGEVLQGTADLKTSACCTAEPPAHIRPLLARVHDEIHARFYGCGFPLPAGLKGATVADLGCGTGRDVYVLAQMVGESGVVHGVDMTEEQLQVARRHQRWQADRFDHAESNVQFHLGHIEDLSFLADNSVDVAVSNCVVNLSPDKERVLAEVARVLKPGGEFHLSDVVVDRRLAPELAKDEVLVGECLGGAMYDYDLVCMAKRVGFLDPRELSRREILIESEQIAAMVGAARFYSVTYRFFLLPDLDARCEDYGQVATYLGTLPQHEAMFWLDDHHLFEAHRPERVCSNTAMMLSATRFTEHFRIDGSLERHFGEFPCDPTMAAARHTLSDSDASCC
ncbi:MAG: arsenite methyltransferase [Kiritimatiellia bacterium]|jgi:arsenite methyltransferase